MGIRDGSFSHFSFNEKWEKEPSLIPIFSLFHFPKVGKGTVPDSHFFTSPTVYIIAADLSTLGPMGAENKSVCAYVFPQGKAMLYITVNFGKRKGGIRHDRSASLRRPFGPS